MQNEYGRKHTDGSRSGGQPVMDNTNAVLAERIYDAVVIWTGDETTNAMQKAAALRNIRHLLRQPTQNDVLKMALEHIEEHIKFAETRIQDGIELGATVWRIALEDMVRESRDVLAALKDNEHE